MDKIQTSSLVLFPHWHEQVQEQVITFHSSPFSNGTSVALTGSANTLLTPDVAQHAFTLRTEDSRRLKAEFDLATSLDDTYITHANVSADVLVLDR